MPPTLEDLWAGIEADDDRGSESGIETEEPEQAGASPPAKEPSLLDVVRRRRTRLTPAASSEVGSSAEGGMSKLPPPLAGAGATIHQSRTSIGGVQFLRRFTPKPGSSRADAEQEFLKSIPNELRNKVRFQQSGPGNRIRSCNACSEPCNGADPAYGDYVFVMWSHLEPDGSGTVQGYMCYWCNFTLRRRYKGFKPPRK